MMLDDAPAATKTFLETFNGGFTGILHWHQLDALWQQLRDDHDHAWYVYAIGEAPPTRPATTGQLHRFIDEVDALLRREHDEDYCGVVYVNRTQGPSLIKIFDPNHLGASCGSSGLRILPGWVLSLQAPVDLEAAIPPTRSRRRWWQGLFAG